MPGCVRPARPARCDAWAWEMGVTISDSMPDRGLYLRRRPCCGNGCRHCPHGHVNVPKRACGAAATAGTDW